MQGAYFGKAFHNARQLQSCFSSVDWYVVDYERCGNIFVLTGLKWDLYLTDSLKIINLGVC